MSVYLYTSCVLVEYLSVYLYTCILSVYLYTVCIPVYYLYTVHLLVYLYTLTSSPLVTLAPDSARQTI